MMSFRGKANWAKMTSPGVKLTALAFHPTKKVNKAEELTYLSINIPVFESKNMKAKTLHLTLGSGWNQIMSKIETIFVNLFSFRLSFWGS
jgi:hypothetical protein